MQKKTKIVGTIGPSSLDSKTLKKMVQSGMNCARINTAYGNLDFYKTIVDNIRKITDIPIIVDLKGPEIRLQDTCPLLSSAAGAGDGLQLGGHPL